MSMIFGIYIGNSSASIALFKEDGKTDVLANDAGDRVTLATVYVTRKEEVVGLETSGNVTKAASTVTRVKTFLNTTISQEEFDKANQSVLVKIKRQGIDLTVFMVPDLEEDGAFLEYSPSKVASLIFKKLYSIGDSVRTGSVEELRCVIAVPLWWTKEVRSSAYSAASDAGWKVIQIINEPSAALLSYLPNSASTTNCIAVVYRLGGFTCDAHVIKVRNGFLSIVSSQRGDIGARAIVDLVATYLADDFRRKTKLEPLESRKSVAKLKVYSERLMKSLSSLAVASVHIESLCEGVDYSASLSRARLDSLLTSTLSDFVSPLSAALTDSELTTNDIDKVIFVGGGLNINKIRSHIGSLFPSTTSMCDWINPQEVIAVGAAIQAGLLVNAGLSEPNEIKNPSIKLNVLSKKVSVDICGAQLTLDGVLPLSKKIEIPELDNSTPLLINVSQDSVRKELNVTPDNWTSDKTSFCVKVNREAHDAELGVATLNISTVEA